MRVSSKCLSVPSRSELHCLPALKISYIILVHCVPRTFGLYYLYFEYLFIPVTTIDVLVLVDN